MPLFFWLAARHNIAHQSAIEAAMGEFGKPTIKREVTLSAAWANGTLSAPARTVDGRALSVVFRGAWTHGFGPDFRDAMICLDGALFQTGGIEIHLETRGWRDHGHHLDERYDDVVLHLVARHDGSETRTQDGRVIPTAVLAADGLVELERGAVWDWSLIGGEVCAEAWTGAEPAKVATIVKQLGDVRLAGKTAQFEAALTASPPADVLFRGILDGLGYAMNRAPMRRLADLIAVAEIERRLASAADRLAVAQGLLFGCAGFLPLAPADATLAHLMPNDVIALENAWSRIGDPWRGLEIKPTDWNRARSRPSNHPAARLNAAAVLLASTSAGLETSLLNIVRKRSDAPAALRDLTATATTPGIGLDRATAIVANTLIPFTLALAEQNGDLDLHDAAAALWDRLAPADPNEVTKRAQRQIAGKLRLPGMGARGQQGLIHLDQTLCGPRRCYECPIGVGALAWNAGLPLEIIDGDAAVDDEILTGHPG
jgi:hypothetical protein